METLWFALGCTSPRHELKVRDDARRYGLASFVPLKYEVKTLKGQERRLLVPAITQLIFVKGTLDEVQDYIANAHYVVYIQRSTYTNHKKYLTVPTKAMEDFIAVTENTERHVTYFRPDEITLREGDKIRVKGGLYDGREGIIMRIKGKRNKHLVVQIPGILIAAVEMSPDMIELTKDAAPEPVKVKRKRYAIGPDSSKTKRSFKSKDLDKDKKLLFDLAHRLLFEFTDRYQNENEFFLLRSELQRTRQRISSYKGFTASAEAELALPLYMASVFLEREASAVVEPVETVVERLRVGASAGMPVEMAEARLRKAISALKSSSLLKVRCQLYLAILSKDQSLLSELDSLFASWRKSSLSPNQRSILEEYDLCVKK